MRPVGSLTPLNQVYKVIDRFPKKVFRSVSVPVESAVGRICAKDLRATLDVPRFRRATFDGYAIRSKDVAGATSVEPVVLKLVGVSKPGQPFTGGIGPGEAVEIYTGSSVPRGADCVAMVEKTEPVGGSVRVKEPVQPGECFDEPGCDVRKGDVLVLKGESVRFYHLPLLCSQGYAKVPVQPLLKVLLVPTGNEVRKPGSAVRESQIYDSSSAAIAYTLGLWGCRTRVLGPVADDYSKLLKVLDGCSNYDLVLLIGGSSAGAEDLVAEALGERGEVIVHGVAVNPGRPSLIGEVSGTPVIGLPGHPASSLAVTFMIVRRVVEHLLGVQLHQTKVDLRLSQGLVADRHMTYFRTVKLVEGEVGVVYRGSSMLSSFAGADGYFIVEGPLTLEKGSGVSVTLFPF